LDIEQVVRAFAQAGVGELFEGGDRRARRRAPGETCAFAGGNVLAGDLVQHGVVEKSQVRFDNLTPRGAARATYTGKPRANDFACALEFSTFMRTAFPGLGNRDLRPLDASNIAHGEPRGRDDAGQFARAAVRAGGQRKPALSHDMRAN